MRLFSINTWVRHTLTHKLLREHRSLLVSVVHCLYNFGYTCTLEHDIMFTYGPVRKHSVLRAYVYCHTLSSFHLFPLARALNFPLRTNDEQATPTSFLRLAEGGGGRIAPSCRSRHQVLDALDANLPIGTQEQM